jgi:hypothetical protein
MDNVMIEESIESGIQVLADYHCLKMINDYSRVDLKLTPSKLIEVNQTIEDGFRARGVNPQKVKRGILVVEKNSNFTLYKIFETINLNRGMNVKLFTRWKMLKRGSKSNKHKIGGKNGPVSDCCYCWQPA